MSSRSGICARESVSECTRTCNVDWYAAREWCRARCGETAERHQGSYGVVARRTGFKGVEKGSGHSGDIEINLSDGTTRVSKPPPPPPPAPATVAKESAREPVREGAVRDLEAGKEAEVPLQPKAAQAVEAQQQRGVRPGPFYPPPSSTGVSRNSSGEVPVRAPGPPGGAVRPGPWVYPKARSAELDTSRNSSGQLRIEPLRNYKDQDDAMSQSLDEDDHMMSKESHMKYELRENPGLGKRSFIFF